MNTQQLIIAAAVAKNRSISKAARELYVSQPTLSQSIARLEESLGTPLFDRQKGLQDHRLRRALRGRRYRAFQNGGSSLGGTGYRRGRHTPSASGKRQQGRWQYPGQPSFHTYDAPLPKIDVRFGRLSRRISNCSGRFQKAVLTG